MSVRGTWFFMVSEYSSQHLKNLKLNSKEKELWTSVARIVHRGRRMDVAGRRAEIRSVVSGNMTHL